MKLAEILVGALALVLIWDAWAGIRNDRNKERAGKGPRHREPGPALPWRRGGPLPESPPRPRPYAGGLLVMQRRSLTGTWTWDVSERTGPITIPRLQHVTPADQLRSIDLSGLRSRAGGPL